MCIWNIAEKERQGEGEGEGGGETATDRKLAIERERDGQETRDRRPDGGGGRGTFDTWGPPAAMPDPWPRSLVKLIRVDPVIS